MEDNKHFVYDDCVTHSIEFDKYEVYRDLNLCVADLCIMIDNHNKWINWPTSKYRKLICLNCTINEVDFKDICLHKVEFYGCSFYDCVFSSPVENSVFVKCRFINCVVENNLFNDNDIYDCYFDSVCFRSEKIERNNIINCKFDNMDFSDSILSNIKIKGCKIARMSCMTSRLEQVTFLSTNANDATFDQCAVLFSNFDSMKINNFVFEKSLVQDCNFSNIKSDKIGFYNSDVDKCFICFSNFESFTFNDGGLTNTEFYLCSFVKHFFRTAIVSCKFLHTYVSISSGFAYCTKIDNNEFLLPCSFEPDTISHSIDKEKNLLKYI